MVLDDPEYRVEPLKYTTSHTNVSDIELGVKYPFDEGHTFIFPGIPRQALEAVGEGWGEERLQDEAERLGRALLEPFIEAAGEVVGGGRIAEEFYPTFHDMEELEEFTAYAAGIGVPAPVVGLSLAMA